MPGRLPGTAAVHVCCRERVAEVCPWKVKCLGQLRAQRARERGSVSHTASGTTDTCAASVLSVSGPCVTAEGLGWLQGTFAVSPKDEKNISKIGQTLENYAAELQNVAGKQDMASS